ncbi:MAG TPA: permease prefix domain 1-containing protein [Anaerolineales bacterium]|nr:permease prefix domain 1-containing protein [Anaerolineales bacterium]
MSKQIENYLRVLKRQLWLRGTYDNESLEEAESHLRESMEAGIRQGLSAEESERQALERFGSVKAVSRAFEKERNYIMQTLLLGIAALAGLFSLYVDTRPTWDDTGILVGGLLLVSGLLTLLGHRRPWLIGLAMGIWIPMYEIYKSHDIMMLVVLLIPLIGAYGGWLVRLGIRKTFHPA